MSEPLIQEAARTETIVSPIDPSERLAPFLRVPDRFNLSQGDAWQLVKGERSGLVFLNPRPTAETIGKFYEPTDYDPFLSLKPTRSFQDRIYAFLRRFVTLRHKADATLKRAKFQAGERYRALDVGCATGDFSVELQRRAKGVKLDLYGIEMSEKAVRFAIEERELCVKQGETLTVDFDVEFDLITMWHVLEHVLLLNETLEKLRRILKPNGLLVVAMPNPDSWDARHYGKHWNGYDAPRHLYHFSPKTFARLLAKHRFRIEDMHSLPLDSYYNALLSEKIRAEAEGRKVGLGAWLNAIWKGSIAASADVERASSVVYYVRKARE
ncbi:MAG: class I SAM-dependent methyltransferase [Chloroherpetonaceae bacterium]|nr:class I SAM-dependent methyltransferase [Chloroherpetonaceae bacterium]MDW8437673.1 class I SAM-dependent methyltransferase [Chloroherpetonaceae bacterium]